MVKAKGKFGYVIDGKKIRYDLKKKTKGYSLQVRNPTTGGYLPYSHHTSKTSAKKSQTKAFKSHPKNIFRVVRAGTRRT